jgi:general secretion pathway protein L
LSTLYIRHPARADSESALCSYALVGDNGSLTQRGDGALANLGELVAISRRVVLLLAGADVTLLDVKTPPLSAARLRAALPALVEEQVLGDPLDNVLVAAPVSAAGMRTVAVVQRDFLTTLVRQLLALGARSVAAFPSQLCLPLAPGSVSAAIGAGELTVRTGAWQGLGLGLEAEPEVALQTARALAGDAPLVLYVPPAQLAEYQALAADAGPGIVLEADDWRYWIGGTNSAPLDLVAGLGASGAPTRDWARWRWPLRLALLALVVNMIGLNVEWLRLRGEANTTRQQLTQTFRSVYPRDPVVDPVAQMTQNIARAKASSGQPTPDEFNFMAAAFGEAARGLPQAPSIASLEYREKVLNIKLKPGAVDPAQVNQLKAALATRKLALTDAGPGLLQIRSAGGAK